MHTDRGREGVREVGGWRVSINILYIYIYIVYLTSI